MTRLHLSVRLRLSAFPKQHKRATRNDSRRPRRSRVAASGWIKYAPAAMSAALQHSPVPTARAAVLELTSEMSLRARNRLAFADLSEGLRMWRLSWTLGWLDIRLRYRGSMLGPFWLTLSTGVMVASLGFFYANCSRWNRGVPAVSGAVAGALGVPCQRWWHDACTALPQAEGMIRSIRMPVFRVLRSAPWSATCWCWRTTSW